MAATYVFEGREWVLTGREATRRLPSGKDKKLIEIRPVTADPSDQQYNKWVELPQLFHVIGDE